MHVCVCSHLWDPTQLSSILSGCWSDGYEGLGANQGFLEVESAQCDEGYRPAGYSGFVLFPPSFGMPN